MNKSKFFQLFCLACTTFFLKEAQASYYGRFISGGFFSKEVFRASQLDRYNDVSVFSERLFLSFDKIGETSNEVTIDLRDKHDFFDKLDAERMRLTSSNKFQVYQMSLRNGGDNSGLKYQAGRFSLNDAGSLFVDGIDFGFRQMIWGFSNKVSVFAGYNPADVGETELTFNSKAKVYGLYDVLESKLKDWDRYFYFANSLVRQMYNSDVDRTYFFNNTIFQNNADENFTSLLYLDIQPKLNIQNWWSSYSVGLENKYKLRTSFSTIDTIHYMRIQDVREVLPSSRYHQASMSLRSPSVLDKNLNELKLTYGTRLVDHKSKFEVKWGTFVSRIFQEEMSANFNVGMRKNFTSDDAFTGFGLIHSNNQREVAFNQDFIFERRKTAMSNLAFVTEGTYTKFFSRSLFGIASVQNTWDRTVSIFSVLFKISYRFGEGGQAPIRDGSPPMGQL